MTKFDYNQKPKRPFGVSFAIFTCFLVFTVLPLLEVIFIVSVNNMMVYDEVGRSGLNIVGFDAMMQQMSLQAVLAIGFFVLITITWFGRPPMIRFIFSGAVGLFGLVTIVAQIIPRYIASPTVMDSSRDVNQPALIAYLVVTVLITLYTIWYMNRWAARAFYRGYYLPEDIEEMRRIEEELMSPTDNAIQKSIT
jgi:magnesium-transporting ATPase (P-type)